MGINKCYAQENTLTLNLENITVKEAFSEVERLSKFIFIFNDGDVDLNRKVSLNMKNRKIDDVLQELFRTTDNVYVISGRQITIQKKEVKAKPPQQSSMVSGSIFDENGEPFPGVMVVVKGTPRGVTTDLDGTFSIQTQSTDQLEISYLGYETQTLKIGKQDKLSIRMVPKDNELGEVTVVAFSKQKKSSVLGSVTSIKPSELKAPTSNLTTSFAGKLAGVIAYQRSGEPGQDNAEFFIRGVTTFGTGKANPLILIDNIELTSTDLSRLNPDDIASFSILKDATATALYGARGANGVILVTTKEGSEGKLKVSFRAENSFSAPTSDVKVADPITFMKLHNEAVRTRDPLATLPYLDSHIAAREQGLNPYVYPTVDWKSMLFKDYTSNQRGNLNLSGGGSIAKYYVALSYSRDNGILNVDPVNNFNNNIQLDKYTVRSNTNINLTKTTELAVRVSGTFDTYQGPIDGGTAMYTKAIKANPVLFPATYRPDKAHEYAHWVLFGNSGTGGEYMNPYAEMLRGYKESEETAVVAQLELKQNFDFITQGLKGRILGSTTRNSYYDLTRDYIPFYYSVGMYDKYADVYSLNDLNPDTGTDYLAYHQGQKKVSSSIYMEASASYDRIFAEKHSISGMLVYTVREAKSANETTLQTSLPSRNMGLAGRFTYGLRDRYFAEVNFGYNGSERFDKDHRWGFFPSGGLGWIVSKEDFWGSSAISEKVDMLKLKGSYGLVGNDNISDDRFFYLSDVRMNEGAGYTFGYDFQHSYNGVAIRRYANNKIGWEVSHKLNLGLEMRLFRDLEIQAEYFTEKRTNILQARQDIPTILGIQVYDNKWPSANIGEAKGHGVDISVDYSHIINKDWWVTMRGNFTYASSEYSKYEEPDYSQMPWLSSIGSKISQPRGLIAERLFVDEEDVANSPKQQFGDYKAGDIKYKDINNDGIIDNQDKVLIGFPTTPEIIYGLGLSFGYKSFDFNCFFQGSARSSFFIDPSKITPFVQPSSDEFGGKKGNNALLQFIADSHWSEENQNVYALWPRLSASAIGNNNQTSTWWLRDGTFLRMKSAEIGYTMPQMVARKIKAQNLRVYLSGTNLLTFSRFKLWDAEMGGNGLGYPIQRVFNIGLQLSF
ncbi:SusC/RagA family TonB-linked outer membrane protein [Bacteroidia bacterium]|nr:SusC/RagA family TonB-linked outer membrane protein [Bacteroidia bacterium]